MPFQPDKTDFKILKLLQENGRITNLQLASSIGLSPAPTLERVRKLENAGFIKSYHAFVDEEKLGTHTCVFALRLVRVTKLILRLAKLLTHASTIPYSGITCNAQMSNHRNNSKYYEWPFSCSHIRSREPLPKQPPVIVFEAKPPAYRIL